MTREQATEVLKAYRNRLADAVSNQLDGDIQAFDMAIQALQAQAEKTCDIEKSNFSKEQYKLDTDTAYECGYNAGLQAQADGEYVRKKDVMGCIGQTSLHFELARKLRKLPTVAIPSATGHWEKTPKAVMGEGYMWYCDKCGHEVYQDSSRDYPSENFCPHCGADMRGDTDADSD